MEKWILDRLNAAADEVNKQLTERNFFMATNVVYNFWLHELCDVYIVSCPVESSSAVLHQISGSDETYDRRISLFFHQEIGTTNAVHLFGLRPKAAPPFYAFRNRRTVATSAEDAE